MYVMEKRYWNCRLSGGGRGTAPPFALADSAFVGGGIIRCNDSRDSEYTSRWPIVVRPETTFVRFVNGLAVSIASLLRKSAPVTTMIMA